MKFIPNNTLAYFQAAPQYHRHDFSTIPVSVFSKSTTSYRATCSSEDTTNEALNFYCMNHLNSMVAKKFTANEPLPEWAIEVLNTSLKVTSEQGTRILHYILLVCVREMRHLKASTPAGFWKDSEAKFGTVLSEFIKAISTEGGESNAMNKYLDSTPPSLTIGQLTAGLSHGFHHGKWDTGYGGKKWGLVADAADSFIHGRTSMEALLDTGFTLVHNNAPIFDKGLNMYSLDKTSLRILLDVQRSGQVPELILDKTSWGVHKSGLAASMVVLVKKHIGFKRDWVDWKLVGTLGALGNYSLNESKQLKLHPEVVEPEPPVIVGGNKIQFTGEWQVYPGQSVQVFTREVVSK